MHSWSYTQFSELWINALCGSLWFGELEHILGGEVPLCKKQAIEFITIWINWINGYVILKAHKVGLSRCWRVRFCVVICDLIIFWRFNSQEWSIATLFWLSNKEIKLWEQRMTTFFRFKSSLIPLQLKISKSINMMKKWFVMNIIEIELLSSRQTTEWIERQRLTNRKMIWLEACIQFPPGLPICPFTNHNHNNCTLLLQLPKIFSSLFSLALSLFRSSSRSNFHLNRNEIIILTRS